MQILVRVLVDNLGCLWCRLRRDTRMIEGNGEARCKKQGCPHPWWTRFAGNFVVCAGGLSIVLVSIHVGCICSNDSSTLASQDNGLSPAISSVCVGAVCNVLEEVISKGDGVTVGKLWSNRQLAAAFLEHLWRVCEGYPPNPLPW